MLPIIAMTKSSIILSILYENVIRLIILKSSTILVKVFLN